MNYIKIIYILSIIFIILFAIYIFIKNFGNNIKQITTTPNYSFLDINEIDIDTINSYIKIIKNNPENILNIKKISKSLGIMCPYFNNTFYDTSVILQYLFDLSSYKKGLIDKKYMDKWHNICNGIEVLKNKDSKN